jgi:PAS domain-containing protein
MSIEIDIDGLQQLTNRLIESDKVLQKYCIMIRTMCDLLPIMCWVKDLEKRYLFANKMVCETLLHTELDDLLGQTDLDIAKRERLGHEHDKCPYHTFGEACHESDQFVLATGKAYRRIEEGYTRGEKLSIDVRKYPFLDLEENLAGVVGCARIVTVGKRRFENGHPLKTEKLPTLKRTYCV